LPPTSCTPSARSSADCSVSRWAAVVPSARTIRCHGVVASASSASTRPASRGDREPARAAMSPYVATQPAGTAATSSSIRLANSMSIAPWCQCGRVQVHPYPASAVPAWENGRCRCTVMGSLHVDFSGRQLPAPGGAAARCARRADGGAAGRRRQHRSTNAGVGRPRHGQDRHPRGGGGRAHRAPFHRAGGHSGADLFEASGDRAFRPDQPKAGTDHQGISGAHAAFLRVFGGQGAGDEAG